MSVKIASAFTCGFCSSFPDSSNQAILMSKVKPELQGRVFAARDLITGITMPLGQRSQEFSPISQRSALRDAFLNPPCKPIVSYPDTWAVFLVGKLGREWQ